MESVSRAKLILADDEQALRTLLGGQLARAGYDVIACANGRAAIDALRHEGSGIVIADWEMPEIDGLALCRMIREQCEMKALGLVYYILLSAHTEKTHVVQGLEAGADDYLCKPYHFEEVVARIRAGQRILNLQEELIRGRFEVNKANSQLAVLNARLERMANTDALTGLYSRRYLLARADEAWALAERSGTPLSCLMMDIDRFKSINDTYGHAAGDIVLKHVATTMMRMLRRYDVCGRFGGEEFVVVCPSAEAAGAANLAERLRLAIAAEPVSLPDGKRVSVAISVGVADRRLDDATPQAMLTRADELLYRAKNGGRNQVWYVGESDPAARFEPAAALTA